MGVRSEYMFQTREEEARPAMMRFGYSRRRMRTRKGLMREAMRVNCVRRGSWRSVSICLLGMVSGRKKTTRIVAKPPRADWSQKITRQERKVTIMPPMNGLGVDVLVEWARTG